MCVSHGTQGELDPGGVQVDRFSCDELHKADDVLADSSEEDHICDDDVGGFKTRVPMPVCDTRKTLMANEKRPSGAGFAWRRWDAGTPN